MELHSNEGGFEDSNGEKATGEADAAIRFQTPPQLIASADAPILKPNLVSHSSFFREAQICPDASCTLTLAEDRSLSLFGMTTLNFDTKDEPWSPLWTYKPSDSILSYRWFPTATSQHLPFFAFTVAVKDHPVTLLDGSTMRLRASYPIVDHRERFVAPHSMEFSPDGTSLYCGFENAIEIIDVAKPGSEGERLHTSPTRSSRDGQKGIISSLAVARWDEKLLAAGSFSGSVGLYDIVSGQTIETFSCLNTGGVTKVLLHPNATLLYCASRRSTFIEVYDTRNMSTVYSQVPQCAQTNQRLGFDIDPSGKWLAVGDQDGVVSIYNAIADEEGFPTAVGSIQAAAHDGIGSTSFHPQDSSLIMTCSGSRSFPHNESSDSDDDDSDEVATEKLNKHSPASYSSLKWWKFT